MIYKIRALAFLMLTITSSSGYGQNGNSMVSTSATLGPGFSSGTSRATGDSTYGNVTAQPEYVRSIALAASPTSMAFAQSNATWTPFGTLNSSFGLQLGSLTASGYSPLRGSAVPRVSAGYPAGSVPLFDVCPCMSANPRGYGSPLQPY